jgi:hypothetical protein
MDEKISALSADTSPATGDLLPIVSVGVGSTMKITLSTIITFIAAAVKTLTNTLFDTAGTGNTFKINGTAISAVTGNGAVSLNNKTITSMSAQAINGSLGNYFTRTLAASETFTQSNFSVGQLFMVRVQQGTSTSYTVTWFSTINWIDVGATAPTQTTTSNGYTTYGFMCTGSSTFDGYLVSTQ